MKITLVAHGYPPELVGGTELAVQGLARGLARRGHEVLVIAGSMDHARGFRLSRDEDADPTSGAAVRVARIHRADLFFDHWQKSSSGKVARAYEDLLDEERPDLVHVHHWIRLTDDLVARAAARGVPGCVTLHDLWSSCLVAFRVRTGTQEFCRAPLAPDPCLACAEGVPPRTPWMRGQAAAERLAERHATLSRELLIARAVVAPTQAHAEALGGFLGMDAGAESVHVVPHGRDLALEERCLSASPDQHGCLELASWAHLHPLKGQDLLLTALRRMPDPSAVRLHLLGGEPDVGYAARLRADAHGLDVTFHGPFDAAGLDRHPATLVHAMVSGSRAHESWGLVVDEAVAMGLPMILPRAGAFPERMTSGAAFYDQGDPDDLARVFTALTVPGAWKALREFVPRLEEVAPSMDAHIDQLQGIYEDVLRKGAPGNVSGLAAPDELDRREAAWDSSLSTTPPEVLGFPSAALEEERYTDAQRGTEA